MWPDPQETADLITFIDEVLNEKLHNLCSVATIITKSYMTQKISNVMSVECSPILILS